MYVNSSLIITLQMTAVHVLGCTACGHITRKCCDYVVLEIEVWTRLHRCNSQCKGLCYTNNSVFAVMCVYMRKGLGIFLENCEKLAATQD